MDERLFAVILAHVKAPTTKRHAKSADDTQAACSAVAAKRFTRKSKLGLPIIIWSDGKVVSVPA